MDWEPREQDIEWTKNVLDSLEVNQDWMEGEMAFRTEYLSPDDYYLVAGEVKFYTWNYADEEGRIFSARVMSPEQIVECVDEGFMDKLNAQHLGSSLGDHVVPPHMRGTYCLFVEREAGEEE
jgi:hypothetical protein